MQSGLITFHYFHCISLTLFVEVSWVFPLTNILTIYTFSNTISLQLTVLYKDTGRCHYFSVRSKCDISLINNTPTTEHFQLHCFNDRTRKLLKLQHRYFLVHLARYVPLLVISQHMGLFSLIGVIHSGSIFTTVERKTINYIPKITFNQSNWIIS